MPDFHKRHKAILLWFRDATHPGFFEPRVRPCPAPPAEIAS